MTRFLDLCQLFCLEFISMSVFVTSNLHLWLQSICSLGTLLHATLHKAIVDPVNFMFKCLVVFLIVLCILDEINLFLVL